MSATLYIQHSTVYRCLVLSVLTLGYICNFIDRQIPTILLELIKAKPVALGNVSIRSALLSSLLFCAAGALGFARASELCARAVQSTGSA